MQIAVKTFIQLLDRIPATFWGIVVGSIFTLTGINLTNLASDRRQERQLLSDRELKNRERVMAFKKETYALAAEAISGSISALSKFSNLDFSLKDISAVYLEKSPVLAKVNLVASEETLRAVANFGREFSGAFLRLSQGRMTLCILQEQIAAKVALLKGFEKTRDAMIEQMRHHNIEGAQDSRRFEAIQEVYEFEANRIETMNHEIQEMIAELTGKHTPFAQLCFAEASRVNRSTIPILVAARMELDLPISEERYAEIFHQTLSKQEEQLSEFIRNVNP